MAFARDEEEVRSEADSAFRRVISGWGILTRIYCWRTELRLVCLSLRNITAMAKLPGLCSLVKFFERGSRFPNGDLALDDLTRRWDSGSHFE